MKGIEYECNCGYATGAQNLLVHLHRLLDNPYLCFERALDQDKRDGPIPDESNNRMKHLGEMLRLSPRVYFKKGESICEKGDNYLIHIVSGSAVAVADGKVYDVRKGGDLIGEQELCARVPLQCSWQCLGDSVEVIYLSHKSVLSESQKNESFALAFFREMAQRLAASSFALLLKYKPVAHVSAKKIGKNDDSKAKADMTVLKQLLKMRKSMILKMLDEEAIDFVSQGARRLKMQVGQTLISAYKICIYLF